MFRVVEVAGSFYVVRSPEGTGPGVEDKPFPTREEAEAEAARLNAGLQETIRQEGSEWVLYSADGTKVLGRFATREEAEAREREIQALKHMEEAAPPGDPPWRAWLAESREASRWAPLHLEGEWLAEGPLDAIGSRWGVVIIREGWSTNGRYYPREVLQAAIPVFEGRAVASYAKGATPWSGHLSPQERRASPGGAGYMGNVVGATVGVYGEDVAGRFTVRAILEVDDPGMRERLLAQWRRDRSRMPGLSIDGIGDTRSGYVAEGRRGSLVTGIDGAHETTIVLVPAAGGAFETLAAAEDSPEQRLRDDTARARGDTDMNRMQKFLEARKRTVPTDPKALAEAVMQEMGDVTLLKFVKSLLGAGKTDEAMEALDLILADYEESMAPEPVPAAEPVAIPAGVSEAQAELQKALAEARAASAAAKSVTAELELNASAMRLDRQLSESKLPEAAQAMIRKRFEGKVFGAASLAESIQEARSYLAINGGGAAEGTQPRPNGQVLVEAVDKLRAEVEAICGYDPARDKSLTEAEREKALELRRYVPRRKSMKRCLERFCGFEDFSEGPSTSRHQGLQEASTGDFIEILGNSMTKSLVVHFAHEERLFEEEIYDNPDVDNFLTQRRIVKGSFAGMPTIAESTSPHATDTIVQGGTPTEQVSTYAITTRGFEYRLSRQAFINDTLGVFADVPKDLAEAARLAENVFRGNLITASLGATAFGDNAYDGVDVYHADHGNFGTAAISYAEFVAMREELMQQTRLAFRTTLNDAGGISDVDASMTLTASHAGLAGTVVRIESEDIHIGAINTTTNVASTLTRGYNGTTAAAHADTTAVWQRGAPIIRGDMTYIVPTQLWSEAEQILASAQMAGGNNNDVNVLNAGYKAGQIRLKAVHPVFLAGDVNNYYCVRPANLVRMFEMAYLGNQKTPLMVYLDDARTSELMFTRLVHRWLVLHEYSGVQTDVIGASARIVTGG